MNTPLLFACATVVFLVWCAWLLGYRLTNGTGMNYRGFAVDVYEVSRVGWTADYWALDTGGGRSGSVYAGSREEVIDRVTWVIDELMSVEAEVQA